MGSNPAFAPMPKDRQAILPSRRIDQPARRKAGNEMRIAPKAPMRADFQAFSFFEAAYFPGRMHVPDARGGRRGEALVD